MIYIACPAQMCSGGPELSHQLCHAINVMDRAGKMCYYSAFRFSEPAAAVRERYGKYGTKTEVCTETIDRRENLLIVPETAIRLAYMREHCAVAVYWMSVDNYFVRLSEEDDRKYRVFFQERVALHLVQSFYAYQFCKNELGIAEERIVFVSDYIGKAYAGKEGPAGERKDYICYNPRKGFENLSKLIRRYPKYCWIPLCGLSNTKMAEYLSAAKIYIDFGQHPGKDRIPREAAACGCCVITNRKGSAGNDRDVPIPERYKIDNEADLGNIIALIDDIFEYYERHAKAFDAYRKIIAEEYVGFAADVKKFLEVYDRIADSV